MRILKCMDGLNCICLLLVLLKERYFFILFQMRGSKLHNRSRYVISIAKWYVAHPSNNLKINHLWFCAFWLSFKTYLVTFHFFADQNWNCSAPAPPLQAGTFTRGVVTMRCDVSTCSSAHISMLVSGNAQTCFSDQARDYIFWNIAYLCIHVQWDLLLISYVNISFWKIT